ncbi:MAG: N-acetyltransferase [Betaproteobacteria bacterium]|nr:MAG: N-acetyltransferase [Betaproteobacteria bacterium]
MPVRLETTRLVLRDFNPEDSNDLFELYRLPETSEFESWGPHKNLERSMELNEYWIKCQNETPRTDYTIAISLNGKFIGLCGLELGFGTESDDRRVGFLGYRIHPEYWNQGLATEASLRILQFGFHELELHRISTGCSAQNLASVKVIKKLGFRLEGTSIKSVPIGERWTDYNLYGMLRHEYQSRR